MEFFSQIFGFGYSAFSYIVPFLFVLTIVVFFHELGHFAIARLCGVTVNVFSVGFGPEIFGWNDKHGTRWRLSWIPLGGYVKFLGDDNAASTPDHDAIRSMSQQEQAGSFHLKSVSQRAAVVVAGPMANFVLAIVIFALLFTFVGRQVTTALVDTVAPDSAAQAAGFQPGDVILQIDGTDIGNFSEMQRIVSTSADRTLSIKLRRDGREIMLTATPQLKEVKDNFGNVQRIGLLGISRSAKAEDYTLERFDPATAVWMAVKETYFVIERTLVYLYEVIIGRQAADQLGGPIRIAQVSGQVATVGILALVQLSAVLSISIGLINLFPIPMLDGGHLLFYAVEAVRGRPLSDQVQEYGFRIGLALILVLMIFATWNDVVNLPLM